MAIEISLVMCARCGGRQSRNGKSRAAGLCAGCEAHYRQEASAWQERDYLHAWLHTREEDTSVLVRRLRERAERQEIDWRAAPPAPKTFDARLRELIGRHTPGRRPRQRRAKPAEPAA